MTDIPRTRLFVQAPLSQGAVVSLTADQAHYLRGVLRLAVGDAVLAFNGVDGEWLADITTLGKNTAALTVRSQRRPQEHAQETPPDLWLLAAPLKGGRTDKVAEKACELGASLFWPVLTRRTDVGRVNTDRLRSIAIEAAEQCERLSVPEVREAARLEAILATWNPDRVLFVAAESGPVRPIVQAIQEHANFKAAFMIGPEGGFDASELDRLAGMPFVVPVGLGARILRADTAAFAVLAIWQALAGDWTRSPSADWRPSVG